MDEAERLAALYELDLLDTAPEKEYEDLVRLASAICKVPISQFTLVDCDRQWFKASLGSDGAETHRRLSFCSHAIQQQGLMTVEDARADVRFRENPLVTGAPHIRFYAGMPVRAPGGAPIGTLCVIDTVPRTLTIEQREGLAILAGQVESRLQLRANSKIIKRTMAENERLLTSLQSTNELFQAFMNNAPFASYIKDADGRLVFYNKALARTFGIDSKQWIGKTDHEVYSREVADDFRSNDLRVLREQVPVELDEVYGTPEDRRHWKSYKFPCKSGDGRLLVAGISIDVTDEIARAKELADSLREKTVMALQLEAGEHLLHSFLDLIPNLSFIKDEGGRYLFYNKAFAAFCGIDKNAWLGKTDFDVFPQETAEAMYRHDLQVVESGHATETLEEVVSAAGGVHAFRTIKFTYRSFDGQTILGGVAVDITDQIRREQELAHANMKLELLAATDPLTGLPNRRVFEHRAAVEFAIARRAQRHLSILVMDIDNFKQRNDLLGHAAGDEALRALSVAIAECTRVTDLAARIGGEEFAYLLPDTASSGAVALAERIQKALGEIQAAPLALTVSIGVATIDATTPNWEQLLVHADDAMYEAKRTGKNRVVVHDAPLAQLLNASRTSARIEN
jgi:diguanylate cyclase (GGDEF)-like protein/PAS domain S-box-containing protein